jgi:hypothetical protein
MDRKKARELETRFVRWPWCDRAEMATLSHWHWAFFDYLIAVRKTTPEALYKEISDRPDSHTWAIDGAMMIYIDQEAAKVRAKEHNLANDNDRWHPLAIEKTPPCPEMLARLRENPLRPRPMPVIKWSPFKPIARVKLWRPETLPF